MCERERHLQFVCTNECLTRLNWLAALKKGKKKRRAKGEREQASSCKQGKRECVGLREKNLQWNGEKRAAAGARAGAGGKLFDLRVSAGRDFR